MTTPRTIQDYGAPDGGYLDALPVEDPTCEQSATYGNRQIEDEAQMTRTSTKAIVRFATSIAAAPIQITPLDGISHMGIGPSALPTIEKTATGRYSITYPASFTDALGIIENINFFTARGYVESLSTVGQVQCAVVSNVINVAVFNAAGSALSDLSVVAIAVIAV